MKVCINCDTLNDLDAVFCSKCGMSLIGAATGEEAVKLKELAPKPEVESRPQPEQPSSMFRIWVRAFTRPEPATYEQLLRGEPNPTLGKAVGWIAIAGLISAAAAGLLNLLFGMAQGGSGGTQLMFWVTMLVRTTVIGVIFFVISSPIMLVIARASGGQGNLGSQSYLLAAVLAPVTVISGSLATIPGVGGVVAWGAMIYGIYLEVVALRAAHQFGWYKAVGTFLWTSIIFGARYCICVFFLGAFGLGGPYW